MLTYGAGMALVLTALTVTLALARGGLLAGLRQVLPYVDRVAGAFLVLAGLYLVYYWIFNLRFDATGSTTGAGWRPRWRTGRPTPRCGCRTGAGGSMACCSSSRSARTAAVTLARRRDDAAR